MSDNFFQNAMLRSLLLSAYTTYASTMIWRRGPKVFVNSIPKAGTHLITSILEEVPGFMLSRKHIDTWSVHRERANYQPLPDFDLDPNLLRRSLSSVRNGQVATGHLPWRPEVLEVLQEMGFIVFFMQRNPTDILNSSYHYITELRRHHLHNRLISEYLDEPARRQALVDGIPWLNNLPGLEPAKTYFEQFEGWKNTQGVIQLHFEELVGFKNGKINEMRHDTLKVVLSALGMDENDSVVAKVDQKSLGKKTFTLRNSAVSRGTVAK